jgi:hypothetical protein
LSGLLPPGQETIPNQAAASLPGSSPFQDIMSSGLFILYLAIVLALALGLVRHIFREKNFLSRLGASLVLVMFLLRLFLVQ